MEQRIIELDYAMLEEAGSYCLRSKKKSAGYLGKNKWLGERMEDGLKYVQLFVGEKQAGFIEYTDGEHSSRVVFAENYVIIHCLWVAETGKGYGSALVQKCLDDAKQRGKHGVAVVTSSETGWTPSKDIFLKNGFIQVDTASPDFELLTYKFASDSENPYFPAEWEQRLQRFDRLTVLRSFQCPYVDIATQNVLEGAAVLGIKAEVRDLETREELMELSPTPYGIFAVIYQGKLVTYHRLTVHSVIKKLKSIATS